jgi:PAS domain S-box-containing protein
MTEIYKELDQLSSELGPVGVSYHSPVHEEVPTFEIDMEGHLLKVPLLMIEITGFSNEELSLLSLQNILFSDDRNKLLSAMGSIAEGAPVVIIELELFSEQSGAHPVEVIMLPIQKGQKLIGAWGVIKDIKGRKHLEESLIRTREVQERSQRFLSDFVSLMAREIRQPLTEMLLTLEMLHSGHFGAVDERQKARMDQLITAVDRLKGILNQAIETSKDAGREIKLEKDTTDLNGVLRRAVLDRMEHMGSKGIKHDLTLPERAVMAPLDGKAMQQAMGNLLDHSMGQLPKGGVIRIDLEQRNEAILVTISDSGPGIPEDEVEQLFERFHVDPDREGGTFIEGLSLYMAKRIIETHGGRIWCESFPGLGTSILITLPVKMLKEGG